MRVLVINSGLWSNKYDNSALPADLPDAHMTWLKAHLKEAEQAGERVFIISHIPPGKQRPLRGWDRPSCVVRKV